MVTLAKCIEHAQHVTDARDTPLYTLVPHNRLIGNMPRAFLRVQWGRMN